MNWIAIHETRTAVSISGLALVLAIGTHGRMVHEFPGFSPPENLPMELLVPAVAAVAVAAAVTTDTMRATDHIGVRPAALKVGRGIWVHLWLLVLGVALVATSAMLTGESPPQPYIEPEPAYEAAIACNMVLMSALAVVTVAIGFANGAWVPPTLLMLSIVYFGGSAEGDGIHWWARIISPDVTSTRIVVAIGAWLVAATAYALLGGYRGGRHT